MKFPPEWEEWGLYPDELFLEQWALYRSGDEAGSEHDRNGAFHWWLRQKPGLEILEKLLVLTELDRDPVMALDVRRYVEKAVQDLQLQDEAHLDGRYKP
ncbi:hypothetical protein KK141_01060 [Dyella sp. LX-66]|nr:hypothetical protein [Dyella sp. LX-1]MBT2138116.1 hypothetical protein [Dyella sp. LX-66]